MYGLVHLPYAASEFQMITSFDIRNYRCFEHLLVDGVKRFNVIVGDNGTGKTTLLEALFLTLSGNVEVSLRLRAQRGYDGTFTGAPRAIEEAIWRDIFFGFDWNRSISISLKGNGPEARSLTISRGGNDTQLLPFKGLEQAESTQGASIQFHWKDSKNKDYIYSPHVTSQGLQTTPSQEDLPQFFLFAANHTPTAGETASRFSQLSTERRESLFVSIFTREFPWIEGLSIEVSGGSPVIHASTTGVDRKVPLNSISGGIHRVLSIMLALAAEPKSIVLVDEIEDGLYYKHKTPLWRGILQLARQNDCQMFLTTHDEEWLSALCEAQPDESQDIALWRFERTEGGKRVLKQFTVASLRGLLEFGAEARGE
jgi:predicted ATPase